MPLPIKNGIYFDIADSEYFSDTSRVNCSALKTVIKNKGATVFLKEKTVITEAMRIGTAFHTLILEPEKFTKRFAIIPDVSFATKEGKAIKEQYSDCVFLGDKDRTSDEDKVIVIKQPETESLFAMKHGLLFDCNGEETLAGKLLAKGGKSEFVMLFEYKGIPCKAKFDRLTDDYEILDIKTCASSDETEFGKAVANMLYFVQAEFYKIAIKHWAKSLDIDIEPEFYFLAVEKTEAFIYLKLIKQSNGNQPGLD